MNNENENEILQKKAKYFCDNNKVVHLVYKNGAWNNGTIKEVSSDFLVFIDREDGEMPVFFSELIYIQIYQEKTKEVSHGKSNNLEDNADRR